MLTQFDPFQEMMGLREAMNQLFSESFVRPTWRRSTSAALSFPIDVLETETGYQVQALLPGLTPENVEVSVLQNTLTLKGHLESWVKPGQQGTWLTREIGTGAFERSITFPKDIDVDKIETSYQHGVLSLSIPFSEVSRPRKISITSAQPNQITVEASSH
ncbi:MAG TPA: Hsp20/alpha crystallin family protein [Ktedonobacteraceae bacterium]|jgi:HSP20 family protein|nr:Hsp20/alpha crystallin family protein [Ktedonobacteraceae bacterium]